MSLFPFPALAVTHRGELGRKTVLIPVKLGPIIFLVVYTAILRIFCGNYSSDSPHGHSLSPHPDAPSDQIVANARGLG